MIAERGPPMFQQLWEVLQPAVNHYVYVVNADAVSYATAADQMRGYAIALEKLVIHGQVRGTERKPCTSKKYFAAKVVQE